MSTLAAKRHTRYQAAILQGDRLLLIRHAEHAGGRSYWLLPGGGREEGESEEQCVLREMREETGLEVRIEHLLEEHPSAAPDVGYAHYKTYLCTPLSGEAQPGYEPEIEASSRYAIVEVRWVNVWQPQSWGEMILSDALTASNLGHVQRALRKLGMAGESE